MRTVSSSAVASLFAQESDKSLITLLTITGSGISTPIRLADSYISRIDETSEDVTYGVVSNSNDFIFLPFQITLPTEEVTAAPRCQLVLNDVTRYLTPTIRSISATPSVQIDIVLSSSPDTIEIALGSFLMGAITYNANTITCDLMVESLSIEPFPCHTFTPSYFSGMF